MVWQYGNGLTLSSYIVFLMLCCFCRPTERELTERQIKTSLKEIMMQKDLENVTCKEVSQYFRCSKLMSVRIRCCYCFKTVTVCVTQIRTELEMNMTCNLREFKEFIDNEMIVILGQMDSPTEIFEHVFLVGLFWKTTAAIGPSVSLIAQKCT